jgi:hypothetical protein
MKIQNTRLDGGTYRDYPLVTAGLVFYADAGNPDSYPGTGTTWYDISGNGYDVTAQNSGDISWNANGYFETGATGWWTGAGGAAIPTGNDPYSMVVWANVSSWLDRGMVSIGGFNVVNQSNAFRTFSPTGLGSFRHYWWGNDLDATSNTANLALNTWFMAVAQFDGTTREIWANVTQLATDTPVGHNVTSSTIQIAKTAGTEYLNNGKIGQVWIYDRALTAGEILQNFDAGRSRYGV